MNIYDVAELQQYLNPQGIDPRSFQSIFPMGVPFDPRSIQSIFPTNFPTGIMTQTQTPDFKRFQGITEETDIDDDSEDIVEEKKESSGVLDLIGMFIPGFNFLRNLDGQPYERFDPRASIKGGIYSIGNFNQPASLVNDFYNPRTGLNRFERAQKRYERTGSVKDLFASSRSGAEFFRRLRERKAANQAATMTQARDIQKKIEAGDYGTRDISIDRGRGSIPSRSSPTTSRRDTSPSSSYSQASYARRR